MQTFSLESFMINEPLGPTGLITPSLFYLVSPSGHLQLAMQHHAFSRTFDCQNAQQPNGLMSWASRKCYIHVKEVPAAWWWFCNIHYNIWQGLALWPVVVESVSSHHWILLMTNTLSDIFPICFPDPDLKVLSGTSTGITMPSSSPSGYDA